MGKANEWRCGRFRAAEMTGCPCICRWCDCGAEVGVCLKCTGLKTAAPPELPAAIPQAASLIEVLTSAWVVPAEFGKLHELLIKDVILTQEGFESEKNKKLDGG